MDRNYWEKIAPGYDEEIFDVLQNDRKSLIRSSIESVADPSKTVIDAGCAIGKWLPVLSPIFKKVIAADISAQNLAIAKKKYDFKNVEYLRTDFSSRQTKLPACDVAVCINAILTDSLKKREAFFANLSRCIKKGGHLVLVLPSLESWMFTHIIQQQFNIDKALFNEKLTGKQGLKKYRNALHGNLDIDSVPTKHYTREELELLLTKQGFTIEKIEKINYNWKTEFIKPPRWLKEPEPWDWMALSAKL
jgi:2-polyprenyl-3-methyl-5-hydroxy-6-metoxy-1,4-benzoquinol methylase